MHVDIIDRAHQPIILHILSQTVFASRSTKTAASVLTSGLLKTSAGYAPYFFYFSMELHSPRHMYSTCMYTVHYNATLRLNPRVLGIRNSAELDFYTSPLTSHLSLPSSHFRPLHAFILACQLHLYAKGQHARQTDWSGCRKT